MKRHINFFILLSVLIVIVVAACVPVSQGVVQLPDALASWIGLGVQIAVVFLFTQLAKWGLNFEGYTAQVVASVTGAVVVFINALLQHVSPNLEGIVAMVFNVLVIVLGSFGTYKLYRQAYPKARG